MRSSANCSTAGAAPRPEASRPFLFEDLGEQQVKNIARPVRVYRVRDAAKAVTPPTLPFPDAPSIAVLPFANMSADPEQEYIADGMVEEIITALSRIRWLFVIARNSSFTYKGQAVDVKQIGRELGVRYVLEGSVRKAGGRVRITGQLIDALSGTHPGLIGSRVRWKTYSTFRTRSRRASRASLSRRCKLPRPPVQVPARPTTSPLTTSTFAPMQWSCRRRGKSQRRSVCSNRR
jgi:TolB-like protein